MSELTGMAVEMVPVRSAMRDAVRVLLALGLLAAGVVRLLEPAASSQSALMADLDAGVVSHVVVELPRWAGQGSGAGPVDVRWATGGIREAVAPVPHQWDDQAADVDSDLDLVLASARERGVPVEVEHVDVTTGPQWSWGGLAGVCAFFYLLATPVTALATRWAWFWLGLMVPAAWLVLVVLEPVPLLGPRLVPRWRLTGGWAFLAVVVAVPVLAVLAPGVKGILVN